MRTIGLHTELAHLVCHPAVETRTAGEEGYCIAVAAEDIVAVDTAVVEGHSELDIAGFGEGIEVVDTAFQYPAGPADSKSRQYRRARVCRRTYCLSIDLSIFGCEVK